MNYLHDISVSPYIFYPQIYNFYLYFIKIDLGFIKIGHKSVKSVINRHGLFLYFIKIDLGFIKIGHKSVWPILIFY